MELSERVVPRIRGRIDVWRPLPAECGRHGRIERLLRKENQIQYAWGAVATQCIGLGNRNFRINAMYVEYENVADPEDPITPPTYGRDEDRSYYNDLGLSGTRDFLRVPLLIQPTIGIEEGFEDFFIPGVSGNLLTFHAQTQGTIGFHGKSFNDGVNSKVFGVALVATPVFADPSQDIVFARTYFDTEDQTPKLASSQIGITWDVVFE